MNRFTSFAKKPVVIVIFTILIINGLYNRLVIQKAERNVHSEITETEVHISILDSLDILANYELGSEEINNIKTVLTNVGITDIWDIEIRDNGFGTQVIKGIIYKDSWMSKEVRVQFNVENGIVFLVSIYCPSYGSEGQPTYLSGLTDRRADLYYDAEGGYIKKIDWDNKAVIDY